MLLALVLLSSSLAASEPTRAELEVAATVVGAAPPASVTVATLSVVREAASAEPGTALVRELPVPGRLVVEVEGGVVWRLEARAAGYFCEARSVLVEPPKSTVEMLFLPTGSLVGRARVARGEAAPEEVEVRFNPPPRESPGGTSPLPASSVRCPVEKNGRFRCEVPAGTVDMRIGARGFVAHYRWGLGLQAGTVVDLGDLAFRRGASVSGFVEGMDGTPPKGPCEVELIPEAGGTRMAAEERERLRRRGLLGRPDERGFFHLGGVPPGGYTLEVRSTGLVAARVPVTVMGEFETHIPDPVRLYPPATVSLRIEPPVRPDGGRWRFELAELEPLVSGGRRRVVAEGEADDTGRWEGTAVAAGPQRLHVLGEDGSLWASMDLELSPGMVPVDVVVPVLRVGGRVTLAGEPLAAELQFLSVPRELEAILHSDEEGRFTGALPRAGRWIVAVQAADGSSRQAGPYDVETPQGGKAAWVEIALPRTRVSGHVVDEEGSPVRGAVVTVRTSAVRQRGEPPLVTTVNSGADGSWEVRGVPPGPALVTARGVEGESETVVVSVDEQVAPPPVRLVLQRWVEVTGRLVSAGAAVPGALVMTMPQGHSGPAATLVPVTSDANGAFQTRVVASSHEVVVAVFARGYAMKVLRLPVGQTETPVIELGTRGGTLTLHGASASGAGGAPLAGFVLIHEGAMVPPALLVRWAQMHGGLAEAERLVVPQMAPGYYALCPLSIPTASERPGGNPCRDGYLPPGGTLTLGPAGQ